MKTRNYYEDAFASELAQLATWRTTRHKPGTAGGRVAAKLAHATKLAATCWVAGSLRSPDELRAQLLDAALVAGLTRATAESVIEREWKRHAADAERERHESLRVVPFRESFPELAG